MSFSSGFLKGAAALAALAMAGPAAAGALQVSPIGFDLPSGKAATVLTVRNDDDAPMSVQVRVFAWTQPDGQDQYAPTNEVVASPAIATLAPHSERAIRIVRVAPPAGSEKSYRLVVDQLPPMPGAESGRVRLLLRHSIPLFFAAPAEGRPLLTWTAIPGAQGTVVDARNGGGRHIRVANLRLADGAGQIAVWRDGLVGYVLAGGEARWTLPAAADTPVSLHADGDAGAIDPALSPGP